MLTFKLLNISFLLIIRSHLSYKITTSFDCCDPWYSFIENGEKTVEGRVNSEKYSFLKCGDIIKLTKKNDETKFLYLEVKDIRRYATFRKMIENETLPKVLPGIKNIADGVKVYRQFYSEQLEKQYGVVGMEIKRLYC
jgi:ASC-1-like (ASCH) protein